MHGGSEARANAHNCAKSWVTAVDWRRREGGLEESEGVSGRVGGREGVSGRGGKGAAPATRVHSLLLSAVRCPPKCRKVHSIANYGVETNTMLWSEFAISPYLWWVCPMSCGHKSMVGTPCYAIVVMILMMMMMMDWRTVGRAGSY